MRLKISGDKLTIASAHMLTRHDKCARIHGHNYQVEIEIDGELNENNMVIDFGPFKQHVSNLFKQFDHKTLLPAKSKLLSYEKNKKEIKITSIEGKKYRLPVEDVEFLPIESTTVELISKYLHDLIKKEFPNFKIYVTIAETPTSKVTYSE